MGFLLFFIIFFGGGGGIKKQKNSQRNGVWLQFELEVSNFIFPFLLFTGFLMDSECRPSSKKQKQSLQFISFIYNNIMLKTCLL